MMVGDVAYHQEFDGDGDVQTESLKESMCALQLDLGVSTSGLECLEEFFNKPSRLIAREQAFGVSKGVDVFVCGENPADGLLAIRRRLFQSQHHAELNVSQVLRVRSGYLARGARIYDAGCPHM